MREEVVGARGRQQARGGMEDVGERLGESDETAGAELCSGPTLGELGHATAFFFRHILPY